MMPLIHWFELLLVLSFLHSEEFLSVFERSVFFVWILIILLGAGIADLTLGVGQRSVTITWKADKYSTFKADLSLTVA